jgi:uncharacterized membrane protein
VQPYGARRHIGVWVVLGVAIAIVAVATVVVVWELAGHPGALRSPPALFGAWGGLLLVILVLWIAFFLVRVAWWAGRVRGGPYGRRGDPARFIARQRYARGEISREQFQQIMTDLEPRDPPPGTGPLRP